MSQNIKGTVYLITDTEVKFVSDRIVPPLGEKKTITSIISPQVARNMFAGIPYHKRKNGTPGFINPIGSISTHVREELRTNKLKEKVLSYETKRPWE